MKNTPQLIVMLTYNDKTVENAFDIFENCKDTRATYWGFKEQGLEHDRMKKLYKRMKECGKTTVMEVVAYTEDECMAAAGLAAECKCDILMGTLFFDSVNKYCQKHNLKYMPFVGNVKSRPSVLSGTAKEMIAEAKKYLKKGVYGFDLLGYRFDGDAKSLIEEFVAAVDAPVCIAGSIGSYEKIDCVKNANAWAFTIGGAFFDNKFGNEFAQQINKVCQYVECKNRER